MDELRGKITDILLDGNNENAAFWAPEMADEILSLIAKTDSGAEVSCSGVLSDAERDMDMIFCLAIARTFKFGSPEAINLLEEYRGLMTKKEEMLEKIKGR